MFTDRQRSFVAEVRPTVGALQFLSVLHNVQHVWEDTWYVVARDSNRYEDHGHLLGYTPQPRPEAIQLYFRYTRGGYVLFVRAGRYTGYVIGQDRHGHYGAYLPAEGNSSRFWLYEENDVPITGTELIYNETTLTLMDVSDYPVGLSRHKDTPHTYLGAGTADGLPLRISLVERNAPYLSYPEER